MTSCKARDEYASRFSSVSPRKLDFTFRGRNVRNLKGVVVVFVLRSLAWFKGPKGNRCHWRLGEGPPFLFLRRSPRRLVARGLGRAASTKCACDSRRARRFHGLASFRAVTSP